MEALEVLITGGAGFIGAKLCERLLQDGSLRTASGLRPIKRITVLDRAPTPLPEDERLQSVIGDANRLTDLQATFGRKPHVIFHLAAVVSVAAERDFDLGYDVNLKGTLELLQLCRQLPTPPHLVMASSAAVYGGPLPEEVGESTALFPQTSYGVQKAMAELLINDYTRKGFLRGCCLRLPTVVVRPGQPNMAASSFASSLVREPLMGRSYVCPVPPETEVSLISVRRVVESFIHAASLTDEALGHTTAVQLPGLTMTVNDMLQALRRLGGNAVADRVSFQEQPEIVKIVKGWPTRFAASRAQQLGFPSDTNAEDMISAFMADEGVKAAQ